MSSVCIQLGFFHEIHTRLRAPKSLLTLYQVINKPDFPSLADEIAEPRPDMNIKFAAFTVSEKSINTRVVLALDQFSFGLFRPYILGQLIGIVRFVIYNRVIVLDLC